MRDAPHLRSAATLRPQDGGDGGGDGGGDEGQRDGEGQEGAAGADSQAPEASQGGTQGKEGAKAGGQQLTVTFEKFSKAAARTSPMALPSIRGRARGSVSFPPAHRGGF